MRASNLLKIAALLLAALTVFLTASCSLTGEETEETTTEPEVVTMVARPADAAGIVSFYNAAVNAIKAEKPGVQKTVWADVRDVDTGDNADAKALIAFAEHFADALDDQSETKEYGSALNDFLPIRGSADVSRLSPADVVEATLEDVEDDRYLYEVKLVLADSDQNGPAAGAFDFDANKSEILNTFTDYRDTVEVSDYDVSYNGCEIYARINKETDQVVWLKLVKNAIVTADVNFTGALAPMGETSVSFNLQQTQEYNDFVWEAPTEAVTE